MLKSRNSINRHTHSYSFEINPLVHVLGCRKGAFDLSENAAERGPGLKHRSDVEVMAHLPDPLNNACHVWKVGHWRPLGFVFVVVFRLSGCSLFQS